MTLRERLDRCRVLVHAERDRNERLMAKLMEQSDALLRLHDENQQLRAERMAREVTAA